MEHRAQQDPGDGGAGARSAPVSRRGFLSAVGAVGTLWLAADPGERLQAAQHAAQQATTQQPRLEFFDREQALDVDAVSARIIPSDGTPGAREAGVIFFLDRALATFAKEQQRTFTDGLKSLGDAVEAVVPGERRFHRLSAAKQDEVLRSIEKTPFFQAMRFGTIAGMFSLPSYGGDRDFVGWKLIGQDLAADFKPPFGWYDRPANRRALLGGKP